MDIVKLAIRNARLTISILFFLLLAGGVAYQSTPKEAEPDVPIPVMYVSLIYQGISPEDSERLLLRPMETKLKSLKGLKEMRSAAFQGGGYVLVEFQPSIDLATALQDTRSKVQDAKAELPQAAEEPTVTEVNISEFPVLVVTLSGNVPERVLTAAARELRDQHRGSARRPRGHAPRRSRRSRRGRHRPDEAGVLRAAARPADPGRGGIQQPGGGRQHRRLARQIRRQGSLADRNAGGYRQPAGAGRPQRRGSGQGRGDGALDLCGCARPSPGSTASPPSPSR